MRSTKVVSAAALCLVSACADNIPFQPTTAALSAFSATSSLKASGDAEVTIVDPSLANIAAYVGRPAGDYALASAELLHDISAVHQASATLIIANDKTRLTPAQWVKNDARRGGHDGLTWGYVGMNADAVMYDPGVEGSLRFAEPEELEGAVAEAMADWENRGCLQEPITRLFPGSPLPPDVFHVGWLPPSYFAQFPGGQSIIGVTQTFVFIDAVTRIPTDIDGNGRPDIAFQDIAYNAGHIYSNNGPFGTKDLFTITAHESGHAFGLAHRGKIFATKNDIVMTPNGPAVRPEDVKFAPKALMNAVYIMGRTNITGTDNSTFCQIWGGN